MKSLLQYPYLQYYHGLRVAKRKSNNPFIFYVNAFTVYRTDLNGLLLNNPSGHEGHRTILMLTPVNNHTAPSQVEPPTHPPLALCLLDEHQDQPTNQLATTYSSNSSLVSRTSENHMMRSRSTDLGNGRGGGVAISLPRCTNVDTFSRATLCWARASADFRSFA